MADRARVILFPGLGADHRLFRAQREAGLAFDVPAFPMPEKRETFAAYACRVAEACGVNDESVVGGVSFGGMLAYQVAAECGAKAVVQISSCTTGHAIPNHYRVVERVARVIPDRFLQQRVALGARLLARLEGLTESDAELVQAMARDVSIPFLRRAGQMVLKWDGTRSVACPVFALHGADDRVIPVAKVRPTEVLAGAGHLLCLKHADKVTAFLANALGAISSEWNETKFVSSLAG